MLSVCLSGQEFFDEKNQKFFKTKDEDVCLEHSLLSISKWESEFRKPFLSSEEKTDYEIIKYIEFMVVDHQPENFISRLSKKNYEEINDYINSPYSATTFSNLEKPKSSNEVITSELIYYWMTSYNIPLNCENWHLNRLFALIKIASIKNAPPKKMSKNEIMQKHRELNELRKQQLGTSG